MDTSQTLFGKKQIKVYLVDTTGILVATTPLYAFMETWLSGMSTEVSFSARLKVLVLCYLGLGIIYSKGRDMLRSVLKIDDTKKEILQALTDGLFNVLFNILISVPIYLFSGATFSQILAGTIGSACLGLISGPLNGYGIDIFRDFFGTKKSKRLPRNVQHLSQKQKYIGVIILIIGSYMLMQGIFGGRELWFPNTTLLEWVRSI